MKPHWIHRILSIFIIGVFLYQGITIITSSPQMYAYADWPGHLDKARKLDWPWRYGWDTAFWGGYPTLTYPMGAHIILRLFLFFSKSDYAAVAFAAGTALLLQLIGIWLLSQKTAINKPKLKIIYTAAMLIALYYGDGGQLGSFTGTLFTGGISGAFGIALLLFFLAAKHPYTKALLIGITLLTHTLTAFLLVCISLLDLCAIVIQHLRSRQPLIKEYFIPLFGGAVIGSPWWLTYLDPAFKGITINMSSDLLTWIVPLSLIALTLLIETRNFGTIFSALIMSSILALVPFDLAHWLQNNGFHGIHFYRFQIMFYLIFISAIAKVAVTVSRKDLSWLTSLLLSVSAVAGLLLYNHQTPRNFFSAENIPVPTEPTRVLDVSGVNTTFNYYRNGEHTLIQHPNFVGSVGLFYESSQNGPIFYSLAKSLNPDFYANGTYSTFFQDYATDSARINIKNTAELLGISYISYFSPSMANVLDSPTATIGAILLKNGANNQTVKSNWHLAYVGNHSLISSLPNLPKVDPYLDLGKWWFDQNEHNLYTRQPLPQITNLNYSQPTIDKITVKPNKISFTVNSSTPTPVLVKFTYNRYWQNTTNPHSPTLWITPGFMLIYAQGYTELTWRPPLYTVLAWCLSIVTIIYAIGMSKKSR